MFPEGGFTASAVGSLLGGDGARGGTGGVRVSAHCTHHTPYIKLKQSDQRREKHPAQQSKTNMRAVMTRRHSGRGLASDRDDGFGVSSVL